MRILFTGRFKYLFGVIVLFAALGIVSRAHAAGYQYYIPITVSSNSSIASGTNANFPMLVSSTLPQWIYPGGHIQNLTTAPNGGQEPADLVFATSPSNCGTSNLNFETESYSSSTGALVDWVNVPSLSAGSVIYACYDNSSVTTDQSNPTGTWNSNYSAVYHFAAPGGVLSLNDSTANANTLSKVGVGVGSGNIGGAAANFNGTSAYLIDSSNFVGMPSSTMSMCSWINTSSAIKQWIISTGRSPSEYIQDSYFLTIGGYLKFGDTSSTGATGFSGASSTASIDDGSWHLVCFVKNALNGTYYTDGVAAGTETSTLNLTYLTSAFTIGADVRDASWYFSGNMGETDLSTAAFSPSWILTEYNNQASPSTFYTSGSEESPTIPLAISNISAKGSTITWTTNLGADSLVNYGTSTTYTASSTYSSAYVTSHSVTLAGLLPNTTYHYQVVSSDGSIATSSDMTFTAAAPAISSIVSAPSGNSVVITWITDAISDSLVNYGTSTTYTASSTYSSAYVTSHSVTLAGLLPNTTYHYQVVSSDGSIATSSDMTFTTSPPAISSILASPGVITSTITWTTNLGADSLVNYGTSTTYTASSTYSSAYVTSHSVTLAGLLPNTTYHYQVVSSDGSIATSSDMTFTTSPLAISNASWNGTLLTWTTNAPSDSLVNYGTSTTYTASSTYSSAYVTSHSVTLAGLLPNTTYHYQVVSSDGSIATSSDMTFTTSILVFLGSVTASGTSKASTTALNIANADFLAACYSSGETGVPTTPIADSLGNTWQRANTENEDGDVTSALWYVVNPKRGTSDIFTASGTSPGLSVMAFSGVAGTIDQSSKSEGNGTPFTTGNITPTAVNELIVSCATGAYATASMVVTAAPPLATVSSLYVGSGPLLAASAYQIQTATATVNPTWSYSITGAWTATVANSFYSYLSEPALSILSTTLPEGFYGKAYSFQLLSLAGTYPFTWTIATGTLPTGLSMSSGGLISGTSTQTISSDPLVFQVQDADGEVATSSLTLTVTSSSISIATTTCPSGTQYDAYTGCTLTATGGVAPYTFSWSTSAEDAIPEGLSINSSTGVISGTVYGEGTYTTQFVATDALGASTTKNISFAINGDNTLGGCSVFPEDSIFHTNISDLPVDTSPAAPIPSQNDGAPIGADFGSTIDSGGIPFLRVPWNQPLSTINTTLYGSYFTSGPFPSYAPIEGTSNSNGDRHVVVLQTAGGGNPCKLWEMWVGINEGSSTWTDSANADWPDLSGYGLTPLGGTAVTGLNGTTNSAGLPILPFLLNYDEVASGVVNHPIAFTTGQLEDNYVWPATTGYSGGGSCSGVAQTNELSQSSPPSSCSQTGPAGEIYRLKASVSTPSQCSTEPAGLAIVQAFRNYGIILIDNGISGRLLGTPDTRWGGVSIGCISDLTLGDFEPVNVSGIMVDPDSAATSFASISSPATSTSLTIPLVVSSPIASTGTEYYISESSTTPASTTSGWTSAIPTSYTFPMAQNSHTLYPWVQDAAGNVFAGASTTINFPYYVLPATSTIQAFISSGIVTSTGASATSTAAVTFVDPVEVPIGSSTVNIPSGTIMTTASNSDFTAIIATTSVDTSGLPANSGLVGTLQYGLASSPISLSQPVTITIPVDVSYNGQTLAVYTSEDGGASWTQTTTCVVSGGVCSFTTSNLSSFAVVSAGSSNSSVPMTTFSAGSGTSSPLAVTTTTATTSGMTVAQMNSLLASLEAELQALEGKVKNQTSFIFTRDLFVGVTGNDVKQLQTFLVAQNVGPAAQSLAVYGGTTYFGSLTKAALAEFQKHVGITPAVGYFGPITRAWINNL